MMTWAKAQRLKAHKKCRKYHKMHTLRTMAPDCRLARHGLEDSQNVTLPVGPEDDSEEGAEEGGSEEVTDEDGSVSDLALLRHFQHTYTR